MSFDSSAEHYVTLFDSHYLPLGLCLYRSLEAHGRPFRLWIVAMDVACAEALERLNLPRATIVKVAEIENDALRAVKATRSLGEYCWTLTPFLPSIVLAREPGIERVTYLDADVYFFDSPSTLLEEFSVSGKHVMITEHGFGPEYADMARYGRFCVQFTTFRNTKPAARVLTWWQERCIEWCHDREEEGKFGDQKYLDQWPTLFRDEVHVLSQGHRTLAPWNVTHVERLERGLDPVFYHFHHLRIVSPSRVVLYHSYVIGPRSRWIYEQYLRDLRLSVATMRGLNIPILARPALPGIQGAVRLAWHRLRGSAATASLC